MKNEHLVPELVINIVDKFKNAKMENEVFNMQLRLEACRDYINEALEKKNKPSGSMIYKVERGADLFPWKKRK